MIKQYTLLGITSRPRRTMICRHSIPVDLSPLRQYVFFRNRCRRRPLTGSTVVRTPEKSWSRSRVFPMPSATTCIKPIVVSAGRGKFVLTIKLICRTVKVVKPLPTPFVRTINFQPVSIEEPSKIVLGILDDTPTASHLFPSDQTRANAYIISVAFGSGFLCSVFLSCAPRRA